jgi:hypothetical protein
VNESLKLDVPKAPEHLDAFLAVFPLSKIHD